jgi:hypothetical protein
MKKTLVFAALIMASQFAHARSLTKDDTAVTWLQAPAQEQAALVTSLAEAIGVSKKPELRSIILCMRMLAAELPGNGSKIEDLFKACLPQSAKLNGDLPAKKNPTVVAAAALDEARLLHEKAGKKDADAMYALAMLIGSEAPKDRSEYEASEWPKYGGRYVLGRYALLMEAASLENKNAAAYLCKVAVDPGAPARIRGSKEKWCSVQ